MDTNVNYDEMLKEVNKRGGFTRHNGLVATKLGKDYAEVETRLTEEGRNPFGLAHGALLFALCDEVTAFAIYQEGMMMLTASANINFMRPGKEGVLRAVGKCIKRGRQMSFAEAEVFDEENQLLCTASVVYHHKPI